MRTFLLLGTTMTLLCAGCQSSQPLRNPDTLDNATAQTWLVNAEFADGFHDTHRQEPESFFNFGMMSRGPLPVLTNIVVQSQNATAATYSLSQRDIARLRRAAAGGLTLVIYQDGIACLSPEIKQAIENEILSHEYSRKEYFRLLRNQAQPALEWTRQAAGNPARTNAW